MQIGREASHSSKHASLFRTGILLKAFMFSHFEMEALDFRLLLFDISYLEY